MRIIKIILPCLLVASSILAVQAENPETKDMASGTEIQTYQTGSCNEVTSKTIQPAEKVEHTTKLQVGQVDGGEAAYGCLGCTITLRGTVLRVLPESDLNRFNVAPKDRFLSINGHKFNPFKFQKECIGLPGTPIVLELLHDGTPEEISVQRIDSRLFSSHNGTYYKKLSEKRVTW